MDLDFIDFLSTESKRNSFAPMKKINVSVNISDARLEKNRLYLSFSHISVYEPDKSFIRLGGVAGFRGDGIISAFSEWKKSKKISGEASEKIINILHFSSSINSVFLARVCGLTPPVAQPVAKLEKKLAIARKKK
ncbi:MAG: hypothetical protein ABII22_05585 [Candidatus Micrarchaeota archaeon]